MAGPSGMPSTAIFRAGRSSTFRAFPDRVWKAASWMRWHNGSGSGSSPWTGPASISTPKPGRTLLDWPSDVAELADGLGLDRFSLMGHSGGGPYAAACAFLIPQRLSAVGLVSSVGPVDTPETARGILRAARTAFLLHKRTPRLLDRPYELTARCISRHPRRVLSLLDRTAPLPDRLLLAQTELKGIWDSHCESVRYGHSGVEQDLRIFTSPWGFRLQDIPMKVHLWHGGLDRVIPPAIGRHIAGRLPDCEARFYSDEGHVSVPINRMEDILGAMACRS